MDSKKGERLAKNTIILACCSLINKGLLFVMLPFFTRWLSLDDYGVFDVLVTYITLLIPVVSLASSNAVFRLSVDDEERSVEYISSGVLLVTVNLTVVTTLIGIAGCFLRWKKTFSFLILLISYVFDDYFQGYLRARKKLDLYAISKTIGIVLTAVFSTVLILVFRMGLLGLILGYSIGNILCDIFIVLKSKYWKYFKFKRCSTKAVKEMVAYSWPLIPNDLAWWIINVSDRSIISYFLSTSSNALYAISYKVPNLCSSIFGVFNISWQESASESMSDEERRKFFQNVFDKLVRIIISISTVVASMNYILFDFVFDSRYENARLYAPILVVSTVFSVIALFYGGIQISLKNTRVNGLSTVVGAFVNVIVHLTLISFVGLYAAAISTLISNIVVCFIRKRMIKGIQIKISIKAIMLFVYLIVVAFVSMFRLDMIVSTMILILCLLLSALMNKDIIHNFCGFMRCKRETDSSITCE